MIDILHDFWQPSIAKSSTIGTLVIFDPFKEKSQTEATLVFDWSSFKRALNLSADSSVTSLQKDNSDGYSPVLAFWSIFMKNYG